MALRVFVLTAPPARALGTYLHKDRPFLLPLQHLSRSETEERGSKQPSAKHGETERERGVVFLVPRFRRRRRSRETREKRGEKRRPRPRTEREGGRASDKGSASMNQCQKGRTDRTMERTDERERRLCSFSAAQQIKSCRPPLPLPPFPSSTRERARLIESRPN